MNYRIWRNVVLSCLIVLAMTVPAVAQGNLAYGDNVLASLSIQAPLAFYTFNGAPGELVSIKVIEVTPGVSPAVSVLGPGQQLIGSSVAPAAGPGAGEAQLSVRLAEAGVFSILVSSASASPGDFLLRLRGTPPVAATPVSSEAPVVADLAPGELVQVFAVSALPDALQPVTVSSVTPEFVFSVQLVNPAGAEVGTLSGSVGLPVSLGIPPGQGVYELWVSSATPGTVALTLGSAQPLPDDQPAAPVTAPSGPVETEEVTSPGSTPAALPVSCTVSSASNVNLRIGPGTGNPVVGVLIPGAAQAVAGVSPDGAWYALLISGQAVWVAADVVNTQGACDQVPVVEAGQAVPTPVVTEAVTVVSGTTTATTTPTATSPVVLTEEVNAGQVATATRTPTATQIGATQPSLQPTATSTSTHTATVIVPTATNPATATLTPTVRQVTATYTPSYTPTTPPAAQIAPEDARFNNPLNIPLDNTASVLDFVSYPGGDTEDRVRWDITGMNQNASFSGGRARLVISISCFGQGTNQIQVFTGGQTYSCGQTIVDREVTYDSRTGSAIITAVGGSNTYVQWVLTGTATRVN